MNKIVDSFVFYKSFYEALKEFDDEVKVQIYDAICEYALYGEEKEIGGVANAIMSLIRPQLEANYKRRMNGKSGGRPKKMNYEKQKTKQSQNITKEKYVVGAENLAQNYSDDFIKAINDFEEMRKKIKKPLTPRAKQMIISKLKTLTGDEEKQIAILNQSTMNCWQGVYSLKIDVKDDKLPVYDDTNNPNIDLSRFDEIMNKRKS